MRVLAATAPIRLDPTARPLGAWAAGQKVRVDVCVLRARLEADLLRRDGPPDPCRGVHRSLDELETIAVRDALARIVQ